MANDEHVAILKKGVDAWNAWRRANLGTRPDLSGADLKDATLRQADLRQANLSEASLLNAELVLADLSEAYLSQANLSGASLYYADLVQAKLTGANLTGAVLMEATLREADLSQANLSGASLLMADLLFAKLVEANLSQADLSFANLSGADLSGAQLNGAYLHGANLGAAVLCAADLRGANLQAVTLVDADLTGADLTGCRIYGVSAWGLKLGGANQQNLVITPPSEPEVTVDNVEVAQFIYLLLHNEKIREAIDTVTSKAVLILGRFTDERKAVLDALRDELRRRNYLPILFDFNVPAARDITETISLLARMARFVVADITDAKSIPQELGVIVPHLPSVPVQPLLLEGSDEYSMFEHFKRYPWVLKTYRYPSPELLIANLAERVIGPAEDYARR